MCVFVYEGARRRKKERGGGKGERRKKGEKRRVLTKTVSFGIGRYWLS